MLTKSGRAPERISLNEPLEFWSIIVGIVSILSLIAGRVTYHVAPKSCEGVVMCIIYSGGDLHYNRTKTSCVGEPDANYLCEWKASAPCPKPFDCNTEEHNLRQGIGMSMMCAGGIVLVAASITCMVSMFIVQCYLVKKDYIPHI